MTLHEAMEVILDRLCVDWRRRGEDRSFDREALQLDLKIPPGYSAKPSWYSS